jgi:hypothetical protein
MKKQIRFQAFGLGHKSLAGKAAKGIKQLANSERKKKWKPDPYCGTGIGRLTRMRQIEHVGAMEPTRLAWVRIPVRRSSGGGSLLLNGPQAMPANIRAGLPFQGEAIEGC